MFPMQIRLFQPEDTEQIAQLFHDTVRQINIQDYSQEQVVESYRNYWTSSTSLMTLWVSY